MDTSLVKNELQELNKLYQIAMEFLVNYSFQLIGAMIVVLVGLFVAGKIGRGVQRLCESKKIDITLSRFIGSSVRIILVVMVAIVALGKIGISVTPFVAAVGALTFGVSLAAQGLISNYGAGVNIIIGRPFVVGDTINVCGVGGVVSEVSLGYTRLINEDQVTITIPNKHIIGEILHNSNAKSIVESEIGVAYGSNMDEVISTIRKAIGETEGLGEESVAQVGIELFADSSVNIGYRYLVPTERLFATKYAVNKNIFDALKVAGISIPFPQREVTLLQGS
ncbi:small conductance mechanosensitive channel [Alteromonadaceae bacterium Bs31]|nr:small conductance mechanosensitive channel [Alteromonadaceae bacterium Bs31]